MKTGIFNAGVLSLHFLVVACGGVSSQQKATLDKKIPENGSILSNDTGTNNDSSPNEPSIANSAPVKPITSVTRDEMDAFLALGPGRALAMVQTDSVKQNDRFLGFKVIGFRTDAPTILGVQPEDIVRAINGVSVERPDSLPNIFERLKSADTVEFTIIRNGKQQVLSTPIQ